MRLFKLITCDACNGKGEDSSGKLCRPCRGDGTYYAWATIAEVRQAARETECTRCINGQGVVLAGLELKPCPECGGSDE